MKIVNNWQINYKYYNNCESKQNVICKIDFCLFSKCINLSIAISCKNVILQWNA